MFTGKSWVAGGVAVVLALVPAVMLAASASGGGIAVGTAGAGPVAAASIVVAPRFKTGDTLTLNVARSKFVEVQGQRTSRQASSGNITIRVLANDASGTRLECVYGAVSQHDETDPEIRNNPLMRVMLASREGMTVRFATGPRFGNPYVENVDEVLAEYRNTLERATNVMPPEVGPAVLRMVEPMLANKQAFAAKLVEDLYIYFAVMGSDVPLQGSVALLGATDSPLGGAQVKTASNLRVERYDRAANRVQLRYQQNSNPQDVQAVADRLAATARKEAQTQLGEAAAQELPAPAAAATRPADISVQDVALYDVDLGSGWPENASRVRTLKMGVQMLVDELTFKRVR
jgi:hypothetical protein